MAYEEGTRPSDSRTAVDYVVALEGIVSILDEAAKILPKKAKPFVDVFKKLRPMIMVAIPVITPLVNPVADAAKKVAEKMPQAAADTLGHATSAVKDAGDAMHNAVVAPIEDAVAKHDREQAQKQARKALLSNAARAISAEEFQEMQASEAKLSSDCELSMLDYPGCYVALTFAKKVKGNDYSGFKDVYVGKAISVGRAIARDFAGEGNPDVYADVKYKQPVYVLLFLCGEDKLGELRDSLVVALDADDSYNARGNE